MINANLYRNPVALDNVAHRSLRIGQPMTDWSVAEKTNGMFLASVEFADACLDYPILFVPAGTDPQGKAHVAPIAAFGLSEGENLYIDGATWRARYIPALMRTYPFGIAHTQDDRMLVMIDEAWPGWSRETGTPLFDEQGMPTEDTRGTLEQIQKIELEIQRTRFFGDALLEAGLLTDMRFEATLSDGEKITVDGFLAIDEAKLAALSQDKLVEFHSNGVLALAHAHQISMRHMQKLVDWRLLRMAAARGEAPPPAGA